MNGTDGTNGTPSVSLVWPRKAVPGKVLEVAIAGSGTAWSSAATVSFGPGITVDSVTRQSESALLARLTVSETASAGARDVTVSDGVSQTLSGGFEIVPFAQLQVLGSPRQSSVIKVRVTVNDPDFAFDFTGGDSFPYVTTGTYPLVYWGNTLEWDARPREVSAVIALSSDTPLGLVSVTVIDRPLSAGRRVLRFPDAMTIVANNATVVTKGSPIDVTFAGPWDSALFALPTTVTGTLGVAAVGQATGVTPRFTTLDSTAFVTASLWDNAVLAGCTSCTLKYFVMSAAGTPGVARFQVMDVAQESEPGGATPTPLTGVPLAVVATMSAADSDSFSVVATAAEVGKTLTFATEGVAVDYDVYEGNNLRTSWFGSLLSTTISIGVNTAGTYSIRNIRLDNGAAPGQYTLTARFH